ncbi:MAG: HEAT repeat domain-containing protein, partial [Methanoregulaceae archaeon]|nr:HEAT repeat domain-containing protein [Methanoregulaceae archaeon]
AVPLFPSLSDKEPNVRRWTAVLIGEIGDGRAIEPLNTLVRDENTSVRKEAFHAIEQINRRESLTG